ncbi:MAG: HD domain-containing phosphohydrolase [Roseateles asaccharophilus]|uniref:HD domain-containing phosphohydrolase n=1 Tax=Roseateles asaccharophilus TaxID=582607 RepID=UPI00391D5AA9
MRSSERVLSRAEIEKSGLGQRIQRLHHILRARYPFLNRIALALYDPESDLLKTFASSTQGGQTLSHYEAPLSGVPSLQRLRDLRQARVVDDIAASFTAPTLHTDWLKAQHYRSSYTRPLYRGQDLAAFIFFDADRPAAFSPEVTEVLDEFADIISQLYLLRLSAVQQLIGAVDIATGLARIRDVETGFHLERMAKYSRLIARGVAGHYGLSDESIEYLHLFAPLHDIGKVGIPDNILLKPGALSPEEWQQMQQHVQIGEELVEHIIGDLGLSDDPVADIMRQVVGGHHERGNGSGYPRHLHMEQIPLPARIVAVADVFDALSCSRPYKQAWPESRCLEELHRQAEQGLLDAHCVQALIEAQEERRSIQQRFAD